MVKCELFHDNFENAKVYQRRNTNTTNAALGGMETRGCDVMKSSKVWVEHENGVGASAILCPYARNLCSHYHECDGNSDCYRDGKAVYDAVDKLIHAVVFEEKTQVAGLLAEIHLAVIEHGRVFLS